MTSIRGAGIGVIRGGGDGRSEFRSDLVDALTAASGVPSSILGSSTSALVIPDFPIRDSGTSALPMQALGAVSALAVADSMINMAGPTGRSEAEDMSKLSLTRAALPRGSDAEPNDSFLPTNLNAPVQGPEVSYQMIQVCP